MCLLGLARHGHLSHKGIQLLLFLLYVLLHHSHLLLLFFLLLFLLILLLLLYLIFYLVKEATNSALDHQVLTLILVKPLGKPSGLYELGLISLISLLYDGFIAHEYVVIRLVHVHLVCHAHHWRIVTLWCFEHAIGESVLIWCEEGRHVVAFNHGTAMRLQEVSLLIHAPIFYVIHQFGVPPRQEGSFTQSAGFP